MSDNISDSSSSSSSGSSSDEASGGPSTKRRKLNDDIQNMLVGSSQINRQSSPPTQSFRQKQPLSSASSPPTPPIASTSQGDERMIAPILPRARSNSLDRRINPIASTSKIMLSSKPGDGPVKKKVVQDATRAKRAPRQRANVTIEGLKPPSYLHRFPYDPNELASRIHAGHLNSAIKSSDLRCKLSRESRRSIPSSSDQEETDSFVDQTFWTAAEKDLFFFALSRHSRLQPSLISRDLGTKSVHQVLEYITLLERGSRDVDMDGLMENEDEESELTGVREMSDGWVEKESTLSEGMDHFAAQAKLARQVQAVLPLTGGPGGMGVEYARKNLALRLAIEKYGEKPVDEVARHLSIHHLRALGRTQSSGDNAAVKKGDDDDRASSSEKSTTKERSLSLEEEVKPASWERALRKLSKDDACMTEVVKSPLWQWRKWPTRLEAVKDNTLNDAARVLAILGLSWRGDCKNKNATGLEGKDLLTPHRLTTEAAEVFNFTSLAIFFDGLRSQHLDAPEIDSNVINALLDELKKFLRPLMGRFIHYRQSLGRSGVNYSSVDVTEVDIITFLETVHIPISARPRFTQLFKQVYADFAPGSEPPADPPLRDKLDKQLANERRRLADHRLMRCESLWEGSKGRLEEEEIDWWCYWEGNDSSEVDFQHGDEAVNEGQEEMDLEREESGKEDDEIDEEEEEDNRIDSEEKAADVIYEAELWQLIKDPVPPPPVVKRTGKGSKRKVTPLVKKGESDRANEPDQPELPKRIAIVELVEPEVGKNLVEVPANLDEGVKTVRRKRVKGQRGAPRPQESYISAQIIVDSDEE